MSEQMKLEAYPPVLDPRALDDLSMLGDFSKRALRIRVNMSSKKNPPAALDREARAHLYEAAFSLILSDFRHLWAYVEPTDSNLQTHSHRLYELLLRSCTEVESACKDLLLEKAMTPEGGRSLTMLDYCKLETVFSFEKDTVELTFWRPHRRYIKPFAGWSTAPLPWYQAYNAVKHNRVASFEQATLEHVTQAVGALFMLMAKGLVVEWRLNSFGVPFNGGEYNHLQVGPLDGFYPLSIYEPK